MAEDVKNASFRIKRILEEDLDEYDEAVSKVTDTASFWHYTSCFFERSHF